MDFFTKSNSDSVVSATFQARCQAARLREQNEMKSRLVVVAIVWILIIAYLISPLSRARIIALDGNISMLTSADIYAIGGFSTQNFLWATERSEIEEKLKQYDYIQDASLTYTPFGIKVAIDEISVVGKEGAACQVYGDLCTFYLSNGNEVNGHNDYKANNVKHIAQFGHIPYINGVNSLSDNQKKIMFKQLGEVAKDVRNAMVSITVNSEVTSTIILDVIINASYLKLNNDLLLQVDLSGIDSKLTADKLTYIRNKIGETNPALINNQYCYIYRSADFVLPCQEKEGN